jgi:Ni/Co efflux regulator RcnB
MQRFLHAALLSAALITPFAIAPTALRADDRDRDRRERSYHDAKHNDEHHWDNHEDKAYRMWAKENHRKYQDFARLRAEDQENYWAWRHEHSDAVLHIDIR